MSEETLDGAVGDVDSTRVGAGRTRRWWVLVAVAVGVVLLMLLVGVITDAQLDEAVKGGIEEQGSRALGRSVIVGGAEVALLSGEGVIRDLKIRNADGFQEEFFLEVDAAKVRLDPWSMIGDEHPVHIEEIAIEGAEVVVEARLFETNLQTLRRHLADARSEREGNSLSRRKVVIDELRLTKTKVRLVLAGRGLAANRTVVLPEIELRDLGGEGGVEPQALVGEIFDGIAEQAWAAASKSSGAWQRLADLLRRRREGRGEADEPAGSARTKAFREAGKGLIDAWRERARDALQRPADEANTD